MSRQSQGLTCKRAVGTAVSSIVTAHRTTTPARSEREGGGEDAGRGGKGDNQGGWVGGEGSKFEQRMRVMEERGRGRLQRSERPVAAIELDKSYSTITRSCASEISLMIPAALS
eukprot:496545-Hanusia_phi.AAC.3